ncbi:PfkB family carbohydrate kinase [Micromonospora sp. NBC_01699]|uniref:carbohydrate kinase family protein n=1 Tax=Micromonospora sp. NBC_01699 TaxID=2975984 RepID=UPI002E326AB8|nr:PfkB family carbohydrate kinase [Micromonospora sp. NBC_01699]
MSGAARIIAVGDIVTDVLAVLSGPLATGSDTPAGIRLTGGGQAANTAAWLAARGHPVTLVAVVGDDETGRTRVAELAAVGVDCAVRRCADAPTGTVIVLAGADERTMVSERGANLRLAPADLDAALAGAPDARHLHLSAYTLLDAGSRDAGRHALAAARERGLTTSVDAASAEPLRQVGAAAFLDWVRDVDLLLANADEAAVLAGPAGPHAQAEALTTVVRHAVVKRGGDGAVWASRGGPTVEAAARRVLVLDATGAGDAFAAGLLAAWTGGAGAAEALASGGEVGALAVSLVGARPVH